MIDFGFDLAGRAEPRLWRGAVFSAMGAVAEASPLVVAYYVMETAFRGTLDSGTVVWATGALVAGLAATWFFKTVGGVESFVATYSLVCDARLRLADHLRRLPMGFWSRQRTGTVSSVLTDEFALYSEIVTHVWSLVVTHLAKPLAIVVVLLCVDWRLGLLALSLLPIALVSIPWSYRLLNRAADRLATAKAKAHADLVEYAQGARTLREYGQTGPVQARLDESLADLEAEMMRTELAPAPAIFSYKLIVWLGFSLLLSGGVWAVDAELVSGPRFLLFALLSLPLYESMGELSNYLALGRFASRTLERIRALFEEPAQAEGDANAEITHFQIRAEGVCFSYEDRAAVRDVSATFECGQVTALVGPSGSGKSTLAHLINRLWDVDDGRITIGGADIRDMSLAKLRHSVATVLQDVVLFRDTVAENIRLGRPSASHAEVVAAAKAARAHDFIQELPDGYETVLGEGGADLSGGQRQRLSIARALILDAPILVLDEATSAVDPDTEHLVQEAIRTLMQGRTVVVIAHRLWTIRHADRILVMDSGRIVEHGKHEELLGQSGLYHRLWETQQASRGWKLRRSG